MWYVDPMIGKDENTHTLDESWVPPESLSKEEINQLPLFQFSGSISLVRTEAEQARALRHLSRVDAVGVDTETRPSFRKGVFHKPSLLQMATADEAFIFLLKTTGISDELAAFFENPAIVKAGVAIGDDIRLLARHRPFTAQGLVDLAKIARRSNICQQGLRGLAAYFFGVRISKSEQCSNWGRVELTDRQVAYAATDAWMSLAIYRFMETNSLLQVTEGMDASTLKAGSARRSTLRAGRAASSAGTALRPPAPSKSKNVFLPVGKRNSRSTGP